MRKERNIKENLLLLLKGIAMGAANKVPGVSGGIIAFVAGFYGEFVYSLQKINFKAIKLLFSRRFNSFVFYINGKFLGILVLGMLISYFSVSKILDYFLKTQEILVWATFFGLIIGSIYYIAKGFRHWNKKYIFFAITTGFLVGISISFLTPAKQNDDLLFIFLCGIISVSGMVLPGLSGSFILILLGNYVLLLVDSVNSLYDTMAEIFAGDFSFVENKARVHMLKILGVFTFGSVVGMVSLSHFLNYLLKRYKNITTATILGFIVGSLGVVWPWKITHYKFDGTGRFLLDSNGNKIITNYERYIPEFSTYTWLAISFILLGILIILFIDRYGERNANS